MSKGYFLENPYDELSGANGTPWRGICNRNSPRDEGISIANTPIKECHLLQDTAFCRAIF